MKTYLIIFLLTVFAVSIGYSQNKNAVISELKNDEVKIKLHGFIEFNDSDAKSGKKFLVADITLENISGKTVAMGTDYTMSRLKLYSSSVIVIPGCNSSFKIFTKGIPFPELLRVKYSLSSIA